MSLTFDATLKGILGEEPADLCKPFRLPDTEPVQTLNVDLSTISAATDIALGFGEPPREIVDLNFQSGPDPTVASRLHLYNAALHLKFQVRVGSILVLLRPKAETPGLTGKLTYTSGNKQVSFEYDVMRMWQERVQPFLEGGVNSLPLAMLCKTPLGKSRDRAMHEVMRAIDRRLIDLPDHAQAVRLMTGAYILAGLRVPRDRVDAIFKGASIMHKTVAWDEAVEEGILKGHIETLLEQGRQLFGDPDAKTEGALRAIHDPNRTKRMLAAILKAKSWKALMSIK